jgi:pilus assembly protein CpaB
MARRTLLLIASILVAALGTALIWLYVQGADARAVAGETQVRVLVSNQTVPPGTPAVQISARYQNFPTSFVQSFGSPVVSDPSRMQGYAITRIVAGMPLLADEFGNAPAAPTPAVDFDPTKLVMQVSLPDPQRLAGILQPGDLIRIFVAQQSGGDRRPAATVLLDKVKVLASGPVIPTSTSTASGSGQVPQAIVTLEVDNSQAKKLVETQTQASGGNSLWFGLLGARTPPVADELGGAG